MPDISKAVFIDYTNYRGERSVRQIIPNGMMYWGSNEWHPEEQWLIRAWDVEKQASRTFAMLGIHKWDRVSRSEGGQG